MAFRYGVLAMGVPCAIAETYCPSLGDFDIAWGSVSGEGNGWRVNGEGGVHGRTSWNLLGGYIEFDMDVCGAQTGVNNNFYTISPQGGPSSGYCDIQTNDSPICMELDIIENNGKCLGQTTWHVWGNKDGGCDQNGCYGQYHLDDGCQFHMRTEFGEDGSMTQYRNGQVINVNGGPSGNEKAQIKQNMESTGAAIASTQWTGWVPDDGSCGGGDANGASFAVTNVVVHAPQGIKFGPSPPTCNEPSPSPSPAPTPPTPPPPSPPGQCTLQSNFDCGGDAFSAVNSWSPEDCCQKCQDDAACGAFTHSQYDASGNPNPVCYLKTACASGGSSDVCTSGTVGGHSPSPSPGPDAGVVEYCPDPAVDFQEEIESGAQGTVTWTADGWSIQGQRRVSSKASFDFSGGGVTWDMDLSQAHNGVNNNFYVTYPYDENCGLNCYCDSGGNHDSQGRGCAELDWTENNGGCYQATTWHDDESGGDGPGYGGSGGLGGGTVPCSAQYSADGSHVDINIGGNSNSGNGQTGVLQSKGAVIYSSQWVGWVPGDCGGGDLGSSVYAVKNMKITGRVVQGPEPRRCHPIPVTTSSPSSSCTGGNDGASLQTCAHSCPSAIFSDCIECCAEKFPSSVLVV